MKTLMKIILHTGETSLVERDMPRRPGYEALRDLVTPYVAPLSIGGHMEHCSVWAEFDPDPNASRTKFRALDMFVNDVGLQLGLPRNDVATEHYRRANQMGLTAFRKVEDPEQLSFIVGTAVLFDRKVWW